MTVSVADVLLGHLLRMPTHGGAATWRCACGEDFGLTPSEGQWEAHQADAIRAALADGSLPWREVAPPEVVAVFDAAVAFQKCETTGVHLCRVVKALPEPLRGRP